MNPVVHLELHTPDQVRASAFYARLLHWQPELIRRASCSYLELELGATVLLEPREGPSGWRSIVATPEAGEVALWERRQ